MDASSQRWIIKDVRGRIFGPFSKDSLINLIKRAVFTGEEFIASYPDGSFIEISKIPEFYDLLLETLTRETRSLSDDERREELTKNQKQVKKEVAPSPAKQKEEQGPQNRVVREKRENPQVSLQSEAQVFKTEKTANSNFPPDDFIELQTHKSIEEKEGRRNVILALVFIILGVAVYFLLGEDPKEAGAPTGQIELLYPKQKRQPIAEPDAKKQLVLATQLFQQDTFSNYYRTMNILVNLLESGYSNVDAMSLLCMTHRELWPYANQDSKDLMAVSKMAQMASQRDPVGLSGSTCRVVQLFLGGQADGAASLTDTVLNEHPTAAAFYEFKSSILISKDDYLSAIGYLDKAQQLWPKWLKIPTQKAALLAKESRQSEAAQIYQEVLKQNATHPVAKVNLGEIEYFVFKHLQVGVELTKTGLDADRLPRNVASRGNTLLAVQLEREQKTKDALEYATKAFSQDPTNLSAKEILRRLGGQEDIRGAAADRELVALGEEYVKKSNHFAAQAEFKAAFEMNPKNGRAAMLAAQSLWELNQSLEAIDWAKKAIQADKTLVPAYIQLADYYSQRYDFKSAVQMLQLAQKIAPQSYQVFSGYALVELRRHNFKGAIDLAKRALKLYDTDVDTHMTLASACLALGDEKCAYETSSRAVSLDTNNRKAQALYAEVLAGYQGVDAASEYLKNLINTYPQQVEYRLAMAKILLKDDRLQPAIEALKQIIAMNERDKDAHMLLGKAHEKNSENREALKSYLSAAALDPADVHPIFLAGELYIRMNEFQKAAEQFQQVVKINQLYPRAHYQLGKTALLMGDADRAFQEATMEKRINPSLADGYVLAGDSYMAKRDYTKAASEYQRAVALQPQASTYVYLARAFRLSENYNVASSLLAKAIKLEDGNADIYKEQGAIFEARGEKAEAVLSYQKYIQLQPNASDRQVIETRIKGLGGS